VIFKFCFQEAQLKTAGLRILNLEKELKSRSVEESANLKRQTKVFLKKEKLLETRLQNENEEKWTLLNTLQEKVSHSFTQLFYLFKV